MDRIAEDERVVEAHGLISRCLVEISKRIVGQGPMIEGMLMGILAGGHVLLEGVPGLAKTLAVKTLSAVLDASFKRIQFTPDLLPADLTGTMIFDNRTGQFVPRKGPIFSSVILADEINRAPAKVQSALLEAMEEHQVTIGDETFILEKPFFVLATQNPIEQEGTYSLPEAQLDRFVLKLKVEYPTYEEELKILRLVGNERVSTIERKLSKDDVETLKQTAAAVFVDPRIEEYIVSIVYASRERDRDKVEFARFIEYGGSPRATIYLFRCAKIRALLDGRNYVVPEDVKAVAHDVLRHRIVLSYEAESEQLTTDDVIESLFKYVKVP